MFSVAVGAAHQQEIQMTNYAAEADKAVKKFENSSEGKDVRKGIAAIAGAAQDFVHDAKENVSDMACASTKHIKSEGQKDLRRAENFIKENPVKGAMYAAGIGAVLSYFLLPRR